MNTVRYRARKLFPYSTDPSLSVWMSDSPVQESVNRRVFEGLMLSRWQLPVVSLYQWHQAEEENALRYVSGYVALRLMRKYQKEDSEKAIRFVECLSNMAVVGDESSFYNDTKESSFYNDTKEWINLVDLGGLFNVNNGAYTFFKSV